MKNKMREQFINNEFVVNCKTENEANEFIKLCYENNLKWENKFVDENEIHWNTYKDKTCYNFNVKYQYLLFSELDFYKQQNKSIITYQEFINKLKGEKMKKLIDEHGDFVNCGFCKKELTDKDELEYSRYHCEFYCCPDHATAQYYEYEESKPFDFEEAQNYLHKKTS